MFFLQFWLLLVAACALQDSKAIFDPVICTVPVGPSAPVAAAIIAGERVMKFVLGLCVCCSSMLFCL
jgi:hypothetical protein